MMQLNTVSRRSRKLLIIALGIALFVGVTCAGGWWYNAAQATTKYNEQKSAYITQARSELKAIGDEFKALAQQADTVKSIETLARLQTLIDAQVGKAPALPQLFGVTLTPVADSQVRADHIDRLIELKKTAGAARTFMAYQQQVSVILQSATTITGPNAAQQKALADAWAVMVTKLKEISLPSQEVASVHQQMIAAVEATQVTLATLPDLFTKKDIPGFAAKQKEVEAHITTLRSLGETVRTLAVTHDQAIARDFAELNASLK
jgi:uncharacterized protein with NAD-binding domain and iron-sulfur cluster